MSTFNNYFAFFGLPAQFEVDIPLLDRNYRKIQSEVHPDKFVSASPAERLQSMQTATLANEAYQTLKQPTARARYLLQLQGVETLEDSNTAMPTDFLMTQMEWREAIEEAQAARDVPALESQLSLMKNTAKQLQASLAQAIEHDTAQAAQAVRKLSFIDKVCADVSAMISRIED
ncbi:MAG TPA: Fe-S protein assembly co-chaperone HscB [Methylophilus sp.]